MQGGTGESQSRLFIYIPPLIYNWPRVRDEIVAVLTWTTLAIWGRMFAFERN